MNLFELLFFLVIVALVMLCSRGLGHVLAIPEGLGVVLVIALLVPLLRVLTKITPRALLYLSGLVAGTSFLSMGLAKALGWSFRGSLLITPVAVGSLIMVIQSAQLAMRRRKMPNTNSHK